MSERPLKIYVIAGEASGDLLGAHLMAALKEQSTRPLVFYGIGGDRMAAQGLSSLFPYQELAIMGFVEVLPSALKIMARINSTIDDILAKQPDLVITIDSPGFCFRVVSRLRKAGGLAAKFVHYVAPSVWAYKPKRAETCAKLFDHLLALLPFEPPYFEQVGLPTSWVGHPVVAEISIGNGAAFREKYKIAPSTRLFTLLPGSRKGEIERHMPIFARAVTLLASNMPDMAMAVAVPKTALPLIAPYFKDCPFRAIVTANEQEKKDAMAAADLAIVKSGTVALEVAMSGAPMLVAYRVNPVSAWAFKRLSLTRYVNLVNILEQREIIPELLQENCTPLLIANAASALLASKELQATQRAEAVQALSKLVPPDGKRPSDIAAQAVLALLGG